jgi:hypothetical protein
MNKKDINSGSLATDVAFVRNHFESKTPVALAILDGPDGNGRIVEGYFFGGNESQQNDEADSWEMEFAPGETGKEVRKVVNGAIVTPPESTPPESP